MKNFMSYGSQLQEINFSSYNLIYLSGKNGHGKSALLDAITWAIWGQARKATGTPKADQGLLRLGNNNMAVIFEFEFNNNRYRIRREVSFHYGKPYALLDFGMFDQEDSLISLTEKTIRMTQDRIEATIGLDYNTYINSAFLRQGQANEFSKKTPKERKDILGSVLGLDTFEVLKKQSLDKARHLQADKNSSQKLLEHIEGKLERLPIVETELTTLKRQFDLLQIRNRDIQTKQTQHDQIEQQYNIQEQQLAVVGVKLEQLIKQEKINTQQLQQVREEWQQTHRMRLKSKDSNVLKNQEQELKKKLDLLQKKQQKQFSLQGQILQKKEATQKQLYVLQTKFQEESQKHKEGVSKVKMAIANDQAQNEQLLKKFEQNNTSITQERKRIAELRAETDKVAGRLKNREDLQHKFDKKKECYQRFVPMYNSANQELEQLIQKQAMSHDENDPSCPLCEQNLSASRKRFLKVKLDKRQYWLENRLARLKNLIKKLKPVLTEEHQKLKQLHELATNYSVDLMKLVEYEAAVQRLQQEQEKYQKEVSNLTSTIKAQQAELVTAEATFNKLQLSDIVNADVPYQQGFKELQTMEKEQQELSYNADEHKQLAQELVKLEEQTKLFENLNTQIAQQSERVERVRNFCVLIKQARTECKALEKERAVFVDLAKKKEQLLVEKTELQKQAVSLLQEKEQLLRIKGQLESEHTSLETIAKESQQSKKAVTRLDTEIDEYKAIAQALGKDGIQALLIEDAIPEIEQEANTILARLTDNQAQIFIESLRDLKGGGAKETLDIKISDAAGLRPYEMFSGGEAFRIDFALRIAISKLLARRAGTSLQTLIIDEGFGSQDEEGLTHIMDAMHKIQDDFAKIIVVSHLASLKEQFPVHFVIEKLSTGSRVSIVENG
ncbi:MAG TPA: SMC family ATPase [Candidatus Babeliales bacterium]|nr:SMC family ATPase [Candidatus Babeliales bacterium]